MIPLRSIIENIWNSQVEQLPTDESGPAVRFQTVTGDSVVEYRACRCGILIDYAPEETLPDVPGTKYPIGAHPLLTTVDEQRLAPEVLLCEEFVNLNDSLLLDNIFIPIWEPGSTGLYAFNKQRNGTWNMRYTLEATLTGPFSRVGLAVYKIPTWCQEQIYGFSSLVSLNAKIGVVKNTYQPILVLSSESSILMVNMGKTQEDKDITLIKNGESFTFDGFIYATKTFARIIPKKGKQKMPSKGLPNPVRRVTSQTVAPAEGTVVEQPSAPAMVHQPVAAAEPQVEDVQTVELDKVPDIKINAAADTTVTRQPAELGITEEPSAPVESVEQPEAAAPKITRRRTAKAAAQDADMLKTMDALAEYLGCPVPDTMTVPQIEEEIRHCRDLGLALSRRMANLALAGTAAGSKLLASVKALVS